MLSRFQLHRITCISSLISRLIYNNTNSLYLTICNKAKVNFIPHSSNMQTFNEGPWQAWKCTAWHILREICDSRFRRIPSMVPLTLVYTFHPIRLCVRKNYCQFIQWKYSLLKIRLFSRNSSKMYIFEKHYFSEKSIVYLSKWYYTWLKQSMCIIVKCIYSKTLYYWRILV